MRNKSRDHTAVCCVAQSQVAWTYQLHITLLPNSAKRHQWKLRTFTFNWFDFTSMILNHMQGKANKQMHLNEHQPTAARYACHLMQWMWSKMIGWAMTITKSNAMSIGLTESKITSIDFVYHQSSWISTGCGIFSTVQSPVISWDRSQRKIWSIID
jgi:hypothetical protein